MCIWWVQPSTYLFIGRYNIISLSGLVWFYDLNILHWEQQPCSCRHDQIGLRDYDIRMVWDGKFRIGSEPNPEQFWGWVFNPSMFWWSAIPLTLIWRKYYAFFQFWSCLLHYQGRHPGPFRTNTHGSGSLKSWPSLQTFFMSLAYGSQDRAYNILL